MLFVRVPGQIAVVMPIFWTAEFAFVIGASPVPGAHLCNNYI